MHRRGGRGELWKPERAPAWERGGRVRRAPRAQHRRFYVSHTHRYARRSAPMGGRTAGKARALRMTGRGSPITTAPPRSRGRIAVSVSAVRDWGAGSGSGRSGPRPQRHSMPDCPQWPTRPSPPQRCPVASFPPPPPAQHDTGTGQHPPSPIRSTSAPARPPHGSAMANSKGCSRRARMSRSRSTRGFLEGPNTA
jgi:hypothetical protein